MRAAAKDRSARVRPGSLLAASLRRDFAISTSYRLPVVLDAVQRLSGLVVIYFLGRLVDRHAPVLGTQGQGGYFGFVLIGMLVLGLATTSLTSYAERLRADQATGTLEAVLAMPCPSWLAVTMNAAYDLAYAAAVALASLVLAVGGFGLDIHTSAPGVGVAVAALVALTALMSSVGISFAAFCIVFKRGNALIGATTAGLTMLGGVYYPLAVLPSPLRAVGAALPFTWGVDVLRRSLLAGQLPLAELGRLLAVTALLVPVAIALFRRALDRARRQGTLTQF